MENKANLIFKLSFALTILIYLFSTKIFYKNGHYVGGDGAYYYAYMRSFCFDGDIDLKNDSEIYNRNFSQDSPYRMEEGVYHFPIGSSILWSPFLFFSHLTSKFIRLLGYPVSINGYGKIYEVGVCLGSIVYGFIGLFLCFKTSELYFDFEKKVALTSVFTLFYASNVIYYFLLEPSVSHCNSLFCVSAFFYFVFRTKNSQTKKDFTILGFFCGLMTLARWQNVLFGVLVLLPIQSLEKRQKKKKTAISLILLSFFLTILPQLVFWKYAYGSFLLIPQGKGFMNWFSPKIFQILFSTNHGLFTWSPILLVAMMGLVFLCFEEKERRKSALLLMAVFLSQLYINSVVIDWWGGSSFGMRRFINCFPIFVTGLSAFIVKFPKRSKAMKTAFLFLIIWNFLSIIQYRMFLPEFGEIPLKEFFLGKFLFYT